MKGTRDFSYYLCDFSVNIKLFQSKQLILFLKSFMDQLLYTSQVLILIQTAIKNGTDGALVQSPTEQIFDTIKASPSISV